MEHDEMLKMYRAMKVYGGGFVQALAECFLLADAHNTRRLEVAFPEIVTQYTKMAEGLVDEEDENEPF